MCMFPSQSGDRDAAILVQSSWRCRLSPPISSQSQFKAAAHGHALCPFLGMSKSLQLPELRWLQCNLGTPYQGTFHASSLLHSDTCASQPRLQAFACRVLQEILSGQAAVSFAGQLDLQVLTLAHISFTKLALTRPSQRQ